MSNNLKFLISLIFIATVAGLLLFTPRALDISTSRPALPETTPQDDRPVRYFGVVARYTPREIYRGYQPIMDYLSAHTPFRFELRLNPSYAGTVEQLARGEIAAASLGSYIYVTSGAAEGLEVILRPLNADGTDKSNSAFVTTDSSTIHSLADLAGKSLLLPTQESLTGQWIPYYLESEAGLSAARLGGITYVPYHTTVAEKILAGEYDAGVVKGVVAHEYHQRGLRTFHETPDIPTIPIVVSARTDSLTRRSLTEAFLAIDPADPATVALMADWDEEFSHGFKLAADRDYDFVRSLITALESRP